MNLIRILLVAFPAALLARWAESALLRRKGFDREFWRHAGSGAGIGLLLFATASDINPLIQLPVWQVLKPIVGQGLLGWLPPSIALVPGLLVVELGNYVSHRLHHEVPILWRLHRVHHADTAVDATTSWRNHPVSAASESLLFAIVVMVANPPPLAVVIWVYIQTLNAPIQHSRFFLPCAWERRVGWLFVTPALHLVHHSPVPRETNSNYGFIFSVWDHLFRTFVPAKREDDLTFGLDPFRAPEWQTTIGMLAMPFSATPPVSPGDPAGPVIDRAAG